jgi:hypothetical protein
MKRRPSLTRSDMKSKRPATWYAFLPFSCFHLLTNHPGRRGRRRVFLSRSPCDDRAVGVNRFVSLLPSVFVFFSFVWSSGWADGVHVFRSSMCLFFLRGV